MDNDDQQIGRILSRREALTLVGVSGAALLVACATGQTRATPASLSATNAPYLPLTTKAGTTDATAATSTPSSGAVSACVVRPAETEGPYFVDEKLNRADIRADTSSGTVKAGALLQLTFQVAQIGTSCTPLVGATVDVWHCDALGTYSDVSDSGFNTKGQTFLRGYQVTDANGAVTFTTIYPGWYAGRAVHIHFKIRTTVASKSYEFTSQLFFDDALSQQVFAQAPYASKGATPDTLNSRDSIYNAQLLLAPTQTSQGYAATFDVGMQLA